MSRQILGEPVNNNEQLGWPQQPNNQQQDEDGPSYPPVPPAPGHSGQPPFPPYGQQPGQPPFGGPAQQYGQAPMFTQAPPKTGMPVWGWIAGGVGAVAVIAVAGVVVFNGLTGGSKEPDVLPYPSVSESAASDETADASEDAGGAVYLFDDPDFTSAPVWSVRDPEGWTREPVKEGEVNYRNARLQCTFTIYQAVFPGTAGDGDEAATAAAMAAEIDGVKEAVGKPVEVVDDAGSLYVNLRNGGKEIELQEAELRFKNDNDADVVYRMAVRATTSSDGLMELALACPGGMDDESALWRDLTGRVSMVDAA